MQVRCPKCGYDWNYSGDLQRATCPNCTHRLKVEKGIEEYQRESEYKLTKIDPGKLHESKSKEEMEEIFEMAKKNNIIKEFTIEEKGYEFHMTDDFKEDYNENKGSSKRERGYEDKLGDLMEVLEDYVPIGADLRRTDRFHLLGYIIAFSEEDKESE